MSKTNRRKARQKRWLKKREQEYQKQRFVDGFRNYFVKKGILKTIEKDE